MWAEGNQQLGGVCPGPDSTLNASREAFAPEGDTLVIIPTLQMRTLTPGDVREIALSWDVAPQNLNTGTLIPEPVPKAGCQAASQVDEPGGPRARRRPRPPAELNPEPLPGACPALHLQGPQDLSAQGLDSEKCCNVVSRQQRSIARSCRPAL